MHCFLFGVLGLSTLSFTMLLLALFLGNYLWICDVHAQDIDVQFFDPKPIRYTLANLPKPFATEDADKRPEVIKIPSDPLLYVPQGFQVNVYADGLDSPRWLAHTPEGDVIVTETDKKNIRLLKDTNKDGTADDYSYFATEDNGLNRPFGMTFLANSSSGYTFFLGNTNAVRAYAYERGQYALRGTGQKITDLPADGYNNHWTRNVIQSPDGKLLYVSVGSGTNVDREDPPRASVQVMQPDGSQRQTFAFGLRNPVGLAFHPQTGQLYAAVNERDDLGDDLVPDYLTRVQEGQFYGWPYAYLTPDNIDPRRTFKNGSSERPDLVQRTVSPDVLFESHSAALGLQFYDKTAFPEKYRNGAFVAFRGSWNRNTGTGYKIVFVPFTSDGRPMGYYEDFLYGFCSDPSVPSVWGRPVGVLVLEDGSLLFTEEVNKRIYRVSYNASATASNRNGAQSVNYISFVTASVCFALFVLCLLH